MYKETNKRSVVKGITWRVLATTTTILIVYFFFNLLDLAIAAGAIETVLKIGLFWMHERAWFKIRWRKKRIETCKQHDHKGAYAKAMSGEFKSFPGVDEVYEDPERAYI